MRLSRTLLAMLVAAALVVAATGCGSSDSSSSGEESKPATTPGREAAEGGATTTTPAQKPARSGGGGKGGGKPSAKAPASEQQELAKAEEEEGESADQSIQEYGSEADEGEEEEVVEAMRGFVRDFGSGDYAAVCEDLSPKIKAQFETFMKAQKSGAQMSCADFLAKLSPHPETAKAKRILAGVVSRVRIGDGNAFILVKPAGEPVSYFVLSRDGGAWKPTSLALGTPLIP